MLSVGVDEAEKTDEELMMCGYEFCLDETSDTNSNDTSTIPNWQRYTMSSIYLAFALISSVIVALFVDPLSR